MKAIYVWKYYKPEHVCLFGWIVPRRAIFYQLTGIFGIIKVYTTSQPKVLQPIQIFSDLNDNADFLYRIQ